MSYVVRSASGSAWAGARPVRAACENVSARRLRQPRGGAGDGCKNRVLLATPLQLAWLAVRGLAPGRARRQTAAPPVDAH